MESEFQKLSPGGAISYVEVPNMQDNLEALESIIKHIYNTIMYAEINTKSDLCMKCGYDGEIQIVNIDGKLVGSVQSVTIMTSQPCMLPAVPAGISAHSTGIRVEHRKSKTESCTYLSKKQMMTHQIPKNN